jgi:hypothetical protein
MPGNVVPQFLLATENKIKSHKKELEKMYSTNTSENRLKVISQRRLLTAKP